jgi:hypothetical protein
MLINMYRQDLPLVNHAVALRILIKPGQLLYVYIYYTM